MAALKGKKPDIYKKEATFFHESSNDSKPKRKKEKPM
jgi:hypothetical protein